MTHAEFENLTGKKIDLDLYHSVIEPAYMNTTFEKDKFAAAWNTPEHMGIIVELTKQAAGLLASYRSVSEDKRDLGYFLADNAHLGKEHRDRAIAILGDREYIRHQIQSGKELLAEDKDLILNLIG